MDDGKNIDQSILFLIISFTCFWLVLDYIYGQQYIAQFVLNIIPESGSLKEQSTTRKVKKDTDEDGDLEDEEGREMGGGGKKF